MSSWRKRAMTHGDYQGRFWASVGIGLIGRGLWRSPSLISDSSAVAVIAGIAALVGVALYEDAFVRAGQSVPLS